MAHVVVVGCRLLVGSRWVHGGWSGSSGKNPFGGGIDWRCLHHGHSKNPTAAAPITFMNRQGQVGQFEGLTVGAQGNGQTVPVDSIYGINSGACLYNSSFSQCGLPSVMSKKVVNSHLFSSVKRGWGKCPCQCSDASCSHLTFLRFW